jgi:nicotinate phosphoribosyltransferase
MIITSLLDLDFYKLTMGQVIFHRYQNAPLVRYALKNRTSSVSLTRVIPLDVLRAELDHVRTLRFTDAEIDYLQDLVDATGRQIFADDYLTFLSQLVLPEYEIGTDDDQILLEFPGKWHEAIYWETIALSIINELYYKILRILISTFEYGHKEINLIDEGIRRLEHKVAMLGDYPDVTFSDFGTRRRFWKDWQEYIVRMLSESVLSKQFTGTSNVFFARKHNITPIGTSAHEMYMAMGAMYEARGLSLAEAQYKVLEDWWDEYGPGLSIALTDTWGTDFFLDNMTHAQAIKWRGLRQDSGNPFEFGEKAIRFYKHHGVDPREKLIVFSDGLDVEKIIALHNYFRGRIQTTFGWGTNLTNDVGLDPVSLVVKLTQVGDSGTVKLSDNLAKASGKPDDIERYKLMLGYTNTVNEECRY